MIATKTPVFYCTEFVRWPVPEIGNSNYKGKPTPVCWAEFASEAERNVHYLATHAEFIDSLSERARGQMLGESYEGSAPVITDPAPRQPHGAPAPERGNRPAPIKVRANKHAGPCGSCGHVVPAGSGSLARVADAWVVSHLAGECPTSPAPALVPKSAPAAPAAPVDVPDGYYAVDAEAGHLSFYRVKAGRKPGIIFVDLLLGGGTNGSLTPQKVPFRSIPAVLAKIAVDPHGAMERFGQSIGRCGMCNRGLTDETSRQIGIGPECRKKS